MNNDKPSINPSKNGPYLVTGLTKLLNAAGIIRTKPQMALCRCGGSENKPFCDGTHKRNYFSDAKKDDRVPDQLDNYAANEITIHDNRGICAHAGHCTDGLPEVFRLNQEPWIDPKAATGEETTKTIRRCPSGALAYSKNGEIQTDEEREPMIFVSSNGPYVVTGGPDLEDTERAEGSSRKHFTLCRCGGSKNKPFCDGTHWHIKFKDDQA